MSGLQKTAMQLVVIFAGKVLFDFSKENSKLQQFTADEQASKLLELLSDLHRKQQNS